MGTRGRGSILLYFVDVLYGWPSTTVLLWYGSYDDRWAKKAYNQKVRRRACADIMRSTSVSLSTAGGQDESSVPPTDPSVTTSGPTTEGPTTAGLTTARPSTDPSVSTRGSTCEEPVLEDLQSSAPPRHQFQLTPKRKKAIEAVRFIAAHLKNEDDYAEVGRMHWYFTYLHITGTDFLNIATCPSAGVGNDLLWLNTLMTMTVDQRSAAASTHHHHHHIIIICSNNVNTNTLETVQWCSLWARHTRLIRALTVALSLHLIYRDNNTTVKTKTS